MPTQIHDPILKQGQKIDDVTIIGSYPKRVKVGHSYDYEWLCRCVCGEEVNLRERSLLKTNHFHSCGCYQKKNLHPANSNILSKAGKARAESSNVDGCNVDMLFRDEVISTNTSGVQGVSWSKTANKWHVYVGYKSKRANLGYYKDLGEATKIRKEALKAIKHGNFEDYFTRLRGKAY